MSNTAIDLRLGWSIVPSQQDFQLPESSRKPQVEIVPNTNDHDALDSISVPALAMASEDGAQAGIVPVPVSIAEPASEMEIDPGIEAPSIKAEPTVTWPASQSQSLLLNTFTGIALLSSVLGMVRFAFQWYRLRCSMQSCQPCSQRVIRLLRRIQKHSARKHSIKVLVSARAMQPFATGLLQWKVVLPTCLETELEDEELNALLAHEIGHLLRGDIMWNWIGEFVCNCFAIQPLNIVARRQWQCASEFLADRWSVEHGRASPIALAKCLTSVAARTSAASQTAPLASAFTEKPGNLLVARVGQLLQLTPVPSKICGG
ncbi:MAG: M56 family metallopeptidase [Pirellulaceae bacterium]|nr:M56 family metallopeptidase [Pirellulaceae bacterium]